MHNYYGVQVVLKCITKGETKKIPFFVLHNLCTQRQICLLTHRVFTINYTLLLSTDNRTVSTTLVKPGWIWIHFLIRLTTILSNHQTLPPQTIKHAWQAWLTNHDFQARLIVCGSKIQKIINYLSVMFVSMVDLIRVLCMWVGRVLSS